MPEEEQPITHVRVERTCFHCKGRGGVSGGQVEYGEIIACPVCRGKGRTPDSISLEEFRKIIGSG